MRHCTTYLNCSRFLSTLSLRRATVCVAVQSPASRFLSTLSLRRATRAESGQQRSPHNFYPRSPCGERLFVVLSLRGDYVFLSTLSLRRATPLTSGTKTIFTNFYPRSPCGERRCLIMLGGFAVDFYPRSPCGERPHPVTVLVCIIEFLSTLSLRRATAGVNSMLTLIQISIHALLAESDCYR